MNYLVKPVTDKNTWDSFVASHPYSHLLQSWSWGEFKSPDWKPIRLGVYQDRKLVGGVQILCRQVFLGKKFFYIPRGPVISPKNKKAFNLLLAEMKKIAKEESAFAFNFEPNLNLKEAKRLFKKGFIGGEDIQPNDTSVLDLTLTEEELLAQMDNKSRQYIRKAQREGVEFVEDKPGVKLEEFINVIETIRGRAKIIFHPSSYYRNFWNIYAKDGKSYLFFIKYQNVIDGGFMVTGYGDTMYELYGGPKNLFPETKGSYLLKWGSILTAKKDGFKKYDQMGLAPTGDSKHHYSGVTIFKERFGGKRVTYAGALYYPISRFWFTFWQVSPIIRTPLTKRTKLIRK